MNIKKAGLALFCASILLSGLVSGDAYALPDQSKPPAQGIETVEQTLLNAFIRDQNIFEGSIPSFETVDLNNDMIMEWIAFDSSCVQLKKLCKHIIIAKNTEQFIILGQFDALKISPSSQYTNGVRDILVYNSTMNEFKPATVKWNSALSSYSPARKVSVQ